MARFTPGPLISDISGSVGAGIFRKTRRGWSVSSLSYIKKPISQNTAFYKSAMAETARDWSSLRQAVRGYWGLLASRCIMYNGNYSNSRLTAYDAFSKYVMTQRLCGVVPVYASDDPNQLCIGSLYHGEFSPGTDARGTILTPDTAWYPAPAETTQWALSCWVGWGKKFSPYTLANEYPAPGPPPRNWYQIWPPNHTDTPFPESGIDETVFALTGGWPGVDMAVHGNQEILREIWVKWRGFAGMAIYESNPIAIFSLGGWQGITPTFYNPDPLFSPTGAYLPSWL